MKFVTNCYLIDKEKNKILLGRKKYGLAKGILNGFGGKVEKTDKTIKDAATREFLEETGLTVINPILSGIIYFRYADVTNDVRCYIYIGDRWRGKVSESSEMEVDWFDLKNVPLGEMWPDDKLWFPLLLEKKNILVNSYRTKPGDFPYKTTIELRKTFEEAAEENAGDGNGAAEN